MSSNSQITLRNGKTLTGTTSADSTELTHEEQIVNMENDNEKVDDQAQSRQSSSGPEIDSQRANDEKFSHLQSEMSMLKAMMEKLLEQNEERNRQTDTNATTSSFAVRSSNIQSHYYFKAASCSACYLTNGDYIRYLLEKLTRENSDRGGEEVEMFSVLIQRVEAEVLLHGRFFESYIKSWKTRLITYKNM